MYNNWLGNQDSSNIQLSLRKHLSMYFCQYIDITRKASEHVLLLVYRYHQESIQACTFVSIQMTLRNHLSLYFCQYVDVIRKASDVVLLLVYKYHQENIFCQYIDMIRKASEAIPLLLYICELTWCYILVTCLKKCYIFIFQEWTVEDQPYYWK